jgi:hypothetical protein
VKNVIMRPHAIRRMGIVAQIDKRHIWQPPGHRIQNRQAAQPRIKDANCHHAPRLLPASKNAFIACSDHRDVVRQLKDRKCQATPHPSHSGLKTGPSHEKRAQISAKQAIYSQVQIPTWGGVW